MGEMLGKCRVVNLYKDKNYDVYIGRPSKWGNPFRLGSTYNGVYLDRDKCLEVYEDWLLYSDEGLKLQKEAKDLIGKTLGCYCKPKKCHGDVLAAFVNTLEE